MRAILFGVGVSLIGVSAANAADFAGPRGSLKDAPFVTVPWTWTGFYGGLTAGYGSGTSSVNVSANNNDEHGLENNDPTGPVLGGTLGYNYQVAPTWLIGVEGDFNWMNLQGDQGKPVLDGHYWTGGWDGLFTLRGRLGYTLGSSLLYVTGGYAAMHTNETVSGNATNEASYGTDWRSGYVVGGGIEHMFTDRVSGKIEYLHAEFEDLSGRTGYPGNYGNQHYTLQSDLDLIRIGVNYKFY